MLQVGIPYPNFKDIQVRRNTPSRTLVFLRNHKSSYDAISYAQFLPLAVPGSADVRFESQIRPDTYLWSVSSIPMLVNFNSSVNVHSCNILGFFSPFKKHYVDSYSLRISFVYRYLNELKKVHSQSLIDCMLLNLFI